MALDSEVEGRLRPVKIRGVVLDEHGGHRAEPPAGPPAVRLVRELKGAGAANRTLTGQPVEPALGRLVAGPGAGAGGNPSVQVDAGQAQAVAPAAGVVRFFLRLLGRDTSID